MRIGIFGTGHIGKTLAMRLSAAGHEVKVANSRGPDNIPADILSSGAIASTTEAAIQEIDVLILSIPLERLPGVASLVAKVSDETVVIDTSNYYPHRDNKIDLIESGQTESVWVMKQLGRPVAKAWNAIGSATLSSKDKPDGEPGRLAVPVAADRERDREVAMALVSDSGFDAYDAGALEQSWRQQPGAPCYCTELTKDEMGAALGAAQKDRLPKRRDMAVAVIQERVGDPKTNPDADFSTKLSRIIFM